MSQQIEPGSATHAAQQRQRASQLAQAVRNELQKAVIGQNSVIDDVLKERNIRLAAANAELAQRPVHAMARVAEVTAPSADLDEQ